MASKLLLGLEFDGEYDPRVRAELEQLVAALQRWQSTVSNNSAQFIVAAADDTLTAERVGVNSPTVRVDFGTPGFAKWHVDQASLGAGYMMGGFGGEDGADGPPGRDGIIGSNGATGATGATGPAFLFRDGEDGDEWGLPGPQGQTGATGTSGAAIGFTAYAAGSDAALHTQSTNTMTDVDAVNAVVTFTAPASGNVLVLASCLSDNSTSGDHYYGLRESTTTVATCFALGQATQAVANRANVAFYITGISAGSHTYKLAERATAGTVHTYSGPNYGQVILQVFGMP